MTTRRFCRATSVFCFTTMRLAPWPQRRASFSRLKVETCAWGRGGAEVACEGFDGDAERPKGSPSKTKHGPSARVTEGLAPTPGS